MAKLVVLKVPEEVVREIDRQAARLGVGRREALRRALKALEGQRTIKERAQAVIQLLKDPEWDACSTSALADEAGVSQAFALKVRLSYLKQRHGRRCGNPLPAKVLGRDGKRYPSGLGTSS